MVDEITHARRELSQISGIRKQELRGYREEQARMIARTLDELKIPHPPLTGMDSVVNWHRFLIRLKAEAKIRNVRCARAVWKTMQQERE